MTNEELFAKLRPIVLLATGVPECILADQSTPTGSKPSPTGAYASITPRQTVSERGQANISMRDVPGDKVEYDVRAQILCSCSVNFFRGQALMYAERLKQANKRPDVSALLFKAGIGWNMADAVNNLTALQSANFEQRAQITLRLMYEASSVVEVNNILEASLSVQYETGPIIQTAEIVVD